MATSVTQYGTTLTFDTDYTVGQYANGDYYIVENTPGGGVTITGKTPASTKISGRTINGMMRNPEAGPSVVQGFDSSMGDGNVWSAAANVARPGDADLSAGNPYVAPAGSSLVAGISVATADQRPQLTDASVFTVLAAAPAADSFSPPYCGSDKTSYWTLADVDFDLLKDVISAAGAPSLAGTTAKFARRYIEIQTQFGGRNMHPLNNQQMYGRDIAFDVGDALLLLHTNLSNAQKEDLVIGIVQYAIDIYGSAVSGGQWVANGGHNNGRKAVLALGGTLLGDTDMLWYVDKANFFHFSEDQQTFDIAQSDVDRTTDGIDKPLASLTVSGGYMIATTVGAHGIPTPGSATPLVRITGATPDGYNGYWFILSDTTTTLSLRKKDTLAVSAMSDASVVGTMTYMDSWSPDERYYASPYTADMIGTAEYGITHKNDPANDNANWSSAYRSTVSNPLTAHALAMHLLDGSVTDWNWSPFFDYMDRVVSINGPGADNGTDSMRVWVRDMYDLYRNGVPTYPFVTNAVINAAGTTLTLTFSQSCTTGAGGAGGFTITASGYSPTVTYFSGSGSTTYAYTLDPAIPKQLAAYLNYTQPGNGIEATADGVDLSSFTETAITNNSTQEAPALIRNWRPIRMVASV